jgi:hypothetical protein
MNMQLVLGFLLILSGIRGDSLVSPHFHSSVLHQESQMNHANYSKVPSGSQTCSRVLDSLEAEV